MLGFRSKNQRISNLVTAALSEVTGKTIKINSEKSLGGGCINHASKLETNAGNFFLKWNSNCQPDIFIREAESLRELKKAAGNDILIPEVFATKQVDDTPGFLVLEYLEESRFSVSSDEKLGWGLAKIHKSSNSQFGFYNNNYCGATLQNNNWSNNWAKFFRDNRLQFLLNMIDNERPIPAEERKLFDKLLNRIENILPAKPVPALIHGDLWSGNFMKTDKGPALIDPAAYYADCEMEFAIITMFGGFSQHFFSAYNEINPLPADWKSRNRLYQLYHVLNHYHLFGGGYLGQAIEIAKSYI